MDELLINKVKAHLRSHGYEEVEENPQGGGLWTHPEWDGVNDHIMEAVGDCLDREHDEQVRRAAADPRSALPPVNPS